MQKQNLHIEFTEFDSLDELEQLDQRLVFCARNASVRAYAPYSGFQVGAAVLLENGEIIDGNNQENAAYPNGLCAERVALFFAGSKFPEVPAKTIAISARNKSGRIMTPVKPCGSCRQVMIETENRYNTPLRVILDSAEKIQIFEGADCLLPFSFKPDSLD